ncbi:MAG: glycogen debranching enzyme, partial [Candidatus Omnitrophota bacterium]
MLSQGTPMILSGDEMGKTQFGNNNAYCQDNEISWINWNDFEKNIEIFEFFRKIIDFRRTHPVLRSRYHLQEKDYVGSGIPDISWHGIRAGKPDFSDTSRTLAFLLCGQHAKGGSAKDNSIYVAINMHWKRHRFQLPPMPSKVKWYMAINTANKAPDDIYINGEEQCVSNQRNILVQGRSIMVLLAK